MIDIAFIAVGSNLGNREEYLRVAGEKIAALPDSRILAESDVEETLPLVHDGDAQPGYLNQMIALETALPPRELLRALHHIERDAGRVRSTRWAPRTLDLDIVMFEHQEVNLPDLQVPHPELPNRTFWIKELAQLRSRM